MLPIHIDGPLGLAIGIAAMTVATIVASSLSALIPDPTSSGRRLGYIDGLRGYLALLVFLHHFALSYQFAIAGVWTSVPSRFYSMSGEVGVSLFFMITGFLFWRRLIDPGGTDNWKRFLVSRLFRIAPAYWLHVLVMTIISLSLISTAFKIPSLLNELGQWVFFSVTGRPDIAGFSNTWRIGAGVTWTLAYEWAFYLSLPVIAMVLKPRRFPVGALLIVAAICILGLVKPTDVPGTILNTKFFMFFVGGILTAYLEKVQAITRFAGTHFASLLALGSMSAVYLLFPSTYGLAQVGLLTLSFMLVALGNSLFGVLRTKGARLLGHISYSIYLFHGIVLYCLFDLPSKGTLRGIHSQGQFLFWISLTALVTVALSAATYRWVELPFMNLYQRYFSGGGGASSDRIHKGKIADGRRKRDKKRTKGQRPRHLLLQARLTARRVVS